jgi:hypothetical protein
MTKSGLVKGEDEKVVVRSYEEETKARDTVKDNEKIKKQSKEFQGILVKRIL